MLTNNTVVITIRLSFQFYVKKKINVCTRIVISAIITFRAVYLSVLCFRYKINIGRTSVFLFST